MQVQVQVLDAQKKPPILENDSDEQCIVVALLYRGLHPRLDECIVEDLEHRENELDCRVCQENSDEDRSTVESDMAGRT